MSPGSNPDETQSVRPHPSDPDPAGVARAAASRADHPHEIGPYRILETLGEGGMGVVYLAEQSRPIHRRVALKIIKLGMDTKQVIARFETEREALALMNHANVAKVLDAGVSEQGRPYFVMEYVAGITITEYCDKHRLNTEERLRLFMDVCNAIQHAHQKGIIHRDIKPSNVLVSVEPSASSEPRGFSPRGPVAQIPGVQVKVIDFGVAKATQHRLSEHTLYTEQGQLIGTPGYMSPEQAEMTALDIDTRTDVYSLGVLLYELLVGAMPFDTKTLLQAGFAEIQRIIREVDPPKPSTKLSMMQSEPGAQATGRVASPLVGGAPVGSAPRTTPGDPYARSSIADIAHRRHTEPKTLIRQIRGDLDWIVMRAMEKDRTRRYDTANGLAMEIRRYLNNEPVLAGPPRATYRLRKFVKRNKGPVAAGIAVTMVLVGGMVGTSYGLAQAVRAREAEAEQRVFAEESEREAIAARDEAIQAREESDQVTQFLSDMLAAADPSKQGKDVTVREVLDRAAEKIGRKFADKPLIEARLRHTVGWTYRGLGLYDKAEAHLTEAAALYRREKGPRHQSTLASLNNLAVALSDRGDGPAADAHLRATLEIQRRVVGEEHRGTLPLMGNLATALRRRGRYAEAEELHRKTLEIQRRILGEEHPETLSSMNNLANALCGQGRYAQAEELYRKTLEIQRRVLGEEHPDTLLSMNNLANALNGQGRDAQAEELYRKTLEIRRHVLGEEHPDTLGSTNNLAIALYDQGRYAQAEELLRKTLEIQRRVLGEEHPRTLLSMQSLANALVHQGRYAQAEELCRKTLEIKRRVLGAEHPSTISSMQGLAETLGRQSRFEEARPLVSELIALRRKQVESVTVSHEALDWLARALLTCEPKDLRDPTAGLRIAEKAVEETGGQNYQALDTLALGYHKTDQIDRAVETQRKALALLSAERTPARIELEGRLGEYLIDQGVGVGRALPDDEQRRAEHALQCFAEAEPLLLNAQQSLSEREYVPANKLKESLERLIKLYESWHAAEPGKGHAEKAAEWRARLETGNKKLETGNGTPANPNAETPKP